MISLRKWGRLVGAVIALSPITAGAAGTPPLSTRPADLTVVQTHVRVSPNRGARLRRIRARIDRPRPLPRSLARQATSSLVVVAAAGELEAGEFIVSVVFVNRSARSARSAATATVAGAQGGRDLEERFVRAIVTRLIGVDVRRKRASVSVERAQNLLLMPPSTSFCETGLPPTLVSALTSRALHVEGAPIVPWQPGPVLRSALGLAFRACGQPLPGLLRAEDVDRFAEEFVDSPGTTSTTLPEECDGSAQLDAKAVTDPAYPGCVDVEWTTPITDCADDLAVELFDAATGRRLGTMLFGHSTLAFFLGPSPIRLVVRVCNGEAGNPGGGTLTLYPIVSWG